MNLKQFFQSRVFKITLKVIIGLIIALVIFRAGMIAGFYKANFSYQWGENYHRNFGGPEKGFMRNIEGKDFTDSHGTVGQIIKLDQNTIVIKGPDNVEKYVTIDSTTSIIKLKEQIKLTDLKIDDYVVIIGKPNDKGQIEAKFIRIMPHPPYIKAPLTQNQPQPPTTKTSAPTQKTK